MNSAVNSSSRSGRRTVAARSSRTQSVAATSQDSSPWAPMTAHTSSRPTISRPHKSANRSVSSTSSHGSPRPGGVLRGPIGRGGTVSAHPHPADPWRADVSRRRCPDPSRPRRRRHGERRKDDHLPRARRGGQPAQPAVPLGRPPARRPRGVLPGEPPSLPVGGMGLPLRRPLLHRHVVSPERRRDAVHPQRLRGEGVHHLRIQGDAAVRGRSGRPRRSSRLADDRRGRRRLRGYEDVIAAQPAEPLSAPVAGTDMLYSSGTTGRPKGVKPPLPSKPLAERLVGRVRPHGAAVRTAPRTRSTCRRRRSTTPRRCDSAWAHRWQAPRSWSWSTSIPRSAWR